MSNEPSFTLEEIKQGYAELHRNVECMTCARLLAYVKDLLFCIEGRGVEDKSVAFTAYNQAIEDAKSAIRGEKVDDPYAAATFINAIARKCSPHVYINRIATTATATNHDCAYADGYADGFRHGKQSRQPSAAPTPTAGGERCAECGSGLYDNPFHFDPSAGTSGLYRWCVFPAPPEPQKDDGWVTFGRVKVDIENETETFERIHPPTPVPAEAAAQWPTDEEAEAILHEHGTSGKEVVNGFIDQVLRDRLRFEEAIKTFVRNRGKHEGEHVFDLTVCRFCDESYVRAEAELDSVLDTQPSTATTSAAVEAAQEIVDIAYRDGGQVPHRDTIAAIISGHFPSTEAAVPAGEAADHGNE